MGRRETWERLLVGAGDIGKERRIAIARMMDRHKGWLKALLDNAKCKKKAETTA